MIEILYQYGYTPEMFAAFTEFGIIANFVSWAVTFVITFIKLMTLSERDQTEFIKFTRIRRQFITQYNSKTKRLIHGLLFLLPMYGVYINTIYLWYVVTKGGLFGIIKGSLVSDSLSIVQVIRYEMVQMKPDEE